MPTEAELSTLRLENARLREDASNAISVVAKLISERNQARTLLAECADDLSSLVFRVRKLLDDASKEE